MERPVYDKRSFRNLPRERCEVEYLFGVGVGPCKGHIHLHHTDPNDPDSRTIQVCNSHHQRLHAALRALLTPSRDEWKTCSLTGTATRTRRKRASDALNAAA